MSFAALHKKIANLDKRIKAKRERKAQIMEEIRGLLAQQKAAKADLAALKKQIKAGAR